MTTRDFLETALVLAPMLANLVVLFRLSAHRRDGLGFLGTFFSSGFHLLRPDVYTDEGQDLLRWAWALTILTFAWVPTVIVLIQ